LFFLIFLLTTTSSELLSESESDSESEESLESLESLELLEELYPFPEDYPLLLPLSDERPSLVLCSDSGVTSAVLITS